MSPLANQNPLAQLNDIIAPSAPNWWPPAPIYWFLSLLTVAIIAAVITLYKRIKKQRLIGKQALHSLQQLKQNNASFIELNQLLKGVCLAYFPRQQVASLHGESWFDFLQRYAAQPIFADKQQFLQRLYTESEQACSDNDFQQVRIWIKQLAQQIKKENKKAVNNV